MDNVQTVNAIYEGFGRGDLDAVLGALEPDIEWHPAEGHPFRDDGRPWVGRAELVTEFFGRGAREWDGFTVTPKQVHAAGEVVVVEGRYTGTVRATGRAVDAQFCHLWTVRGDRVAAFQQYMDTAQLRLAFGLG